MRARPAVGRSEKLGGDALRDANRQAWRICTIGKIRPHDKKRTLSQRGYLTRLIPSTRITESEYPDEARNQDQFPAANYEDCGCVPSLALPRRRYPRSLGRPPRRSEMGAARQRHRRLCPTRR